MSAQADAVEALIRENAEMKDRLLRTLAEMENLRRRTEREIAGEPRLRRHRLRARRAWWPPTTYGVRSMLLAGTGNLRRTLPGRRCLTVWN